MVEVDEVATVLHQLTLLSFDYQVDDVMNDCLGTDGRVGVGALKPPLLNHATSFANEAQD